jgi:hypothetical protein
MYEPNVYDRVRVVHTTHKDLDGQEATVMGVYGAACAIILFKEKPTNYNPAIVIVNSCLEKVE